MNNDSSADERPPEPMPAGGGDNEALKRNIKAGSTWLRLFFMIVVAFLYGISRVVVGAVVVLQFFWVLFTGSRNENLLQLGQSLATYTYQVISYLTFVSEERPFPIDADWPSGAP